MKKNTPIIPSSSFEFLKKLRKNNNREWFNANKDMYQRELAAVESFADSLLMRMKEHDRIDTLSGKKALMRIYRDIRFSADKTPYKTCFSGSFHREGKLLRGGYYFQLEPGNSFIAGGFWGPVPADLKLIRDEIAFDDGPMRKMLASVKKAGIFPGLTGETLSRVPRGYDPNSPGADLLKHKQFILQRPFKDAEVLNPGFLDTAVTTMKGLRPFFDYMSEVLYVAA